MISKRFNHPYSIPNEEVSHMEKLFMRSVFGLSVIFLAVLVLPAMSVFGQAAVSATKTRTTVGTPYDYTVNFTVRATRAIICDIEIQVADPHDTLLGFVSVPPNWSVQSPSLEANALFAKADNLPVETHCIKKGKTGTFKVQVNPGTPPFEFNICFSDKNGNLLGSCLKLGVSSFAAYPEPSADVMVNQLGNQLEFAARPELESFIQSMSVAVFDISGRLMTRHEVSGSSLRWTGLSSEGRRLAKGVYLAVVTMQGINGEVLRKVHKFVVR
jgi:hypothetical protein